MVNWYWFVGAVLAFFAVFGFLWFMSGVLLGLNQIFYIDGHEEHVNRARARAVSGFFTMLNIFVIWVAVRMVATLFGADTVDLGGAFSILLTYFILWAIWRLWHLFIKKSTIDI